MWVKHITETDLASGAWTCLCAQQNHKPCSALERAFLTSRGARLFFKIFLPCCLIIPYSFFFFFLEFQEFGSCAMLGFKELGRPKERAWIPFTLLLLPPNQSCWKARLVTVDSGGPVRPCRSRGAKAPSTELQLGGRISLWRGWGNKKKLFALS